MPLLKFAEHLFYFLMFAGNAFFAVQNGITTVFSQLSSGINHLGLALAIGGAFYFAPGAFRFVDGFFKFKYGYGRNG